MGKYDGLKKFIPVLDAEAPIVFEEEEGCVRAEYPEAVFRFLDVLEAFLEKHADDPEADKLKELLGIFEREEDCPGLIAGYVLNGSLAEVLKSLGGGE